MTVYFLSERDVEALKALFRNEKRYGSTSIFAPGSEPVNLYVAEPLSPGGLEPYQEGESSPGLCRVFMVAESEGYTVLKEVPSFRVLVHNLSPFRLTSRFIAAQTKHGTWIGLQPLGMTDVYYFRLLEDLPSVFVEGHPVPRLAVWRRSFNVDTNEWEVRVPLSTGTGTGTGSLEEPVVEINGEWYYGYDLFYVADLRRIGYCGPAGTNGAAEIVPSHPPAMKFLEAWGLGLLVPQLAIVDLAVESYEC